ncbi:MAG: isoprenylcysteine carboxylmethyltransferase family protein [Actinomycetota bacterium]|nr:isoprenylcysteine carboxylmethyltransferase family protein [Actinomycetota bacterium]
MRKRNAAWGTGVFLICAPGVVAGGAPVWIASRGTGPHWTELPIAAGLGWACIAAGTAVILESFARFVLDGRGTPAPIAPTEHLVVRGMYRWLRNPMYVAVLLVIAGESLLFADPLVLGYGVLVGIAVTSFVRWYEEPTLAKKFPAQYAAYRATVPGWWPKRPRAAVTSEAPNSP